MISPNSKPDELPSFRLDGRLAVITGASDGIGRAFALAYARSGAELLLVSRRIEKLKEVKASIEGAEDRVHVISADVSKSGDIERIEQESARLIKSKRGEQGLILVNCAGFGFTKPALETTEEDWDRLLDTHLKGTFFCCQALGRLMVERGYGKIVNLSSTWSASTDIGKSVYG